MMPDADPQDEQEDSLPDTHTAAPRYIGEGETEDHRGLEDWDHPDHPSNASKPEGAEDLMDLMRTLYLYKHMGPRLSVPPNERSMTTANLRLFCRELGIPIPEYLTHLHEGVEAERDSDGKIRYTTEPSANSLSNPHNPRFTLPDFTPLPKHDPQDDANFKAARADDLSRYERKLTKALRSGKDLTQVPFASKVLYQPGLNRLRTKLANVQTNAEIRTILTTFLEETS